MLRPIGNLLFVGLVGLLLSGCGPERLGFGREVQPTATPTTVPVATFTPTPPAPTDVPPAAPPPPTLLEPTAVPAVEVGQAVTATAALTSPVAAEPVEDATQSLLPTATATPAPDGPTDPDLADDAPEDGVAEENVPSNNVAEQPAPIDEAYAVINVEAANVRGGPSTDYPVVGAVAAGEQYPLTGRNAQGDWWQICCFAEQPGWIYAPLVEVQNTDLVAEVTDLPPPPAQPIQAPVAESAPSETAPIEEAPADPAPEAPASTDTNAHSGTAGNFDPNAQYQIVHYRVLGFADNNGGIFNKGGQQFIFVTVLDQNGNPIDGAVLKDAVGDKLNVVTGDKGPGKAEIKMDWDPYKLYVAADPGGTVTSQISNQMNNPYPHIPDVVGLLGPPDNEYAICPTIDDRCTPPFYHAHWSYEITFQRVK